MTMPNAQTTAVVLAAGQGKRMKSTLPKVLHCVLGRPMILYVLDQLREAGLEAPVLVLGHGGDQVEPVVAGRGRVAWQREQLGTGHAVKCAMPALEGFDGDVIVTCGDTPLIPSSTYRRLLEARAAGAAAVVATTVLADAASYGRIKRDGAGRVLGIVEFKDATPEERAIREINTGTYCFSAAALRGTLDRLGNKNAQGEYYLTDTLGLLLAAGERVEGVCFENPGQFLGVNDPSDLAEIESVLGESIRRGHMKNGVVIEEPQTVRIEPSVVIGPRTRIRPGTILEGNTMVGADCEVGPGMTLRDFVLADGCVAKVGILSANRCGSL